MTSSLLPMSLRLFMENAGLSKKNNWKVASSGACSPELLFKEAMAASTFSPPILGSGSHGSTKGL